MATPSSIWSVIMKSASRGDFHRVCIIPLCNFVCARPKFPQKLWLPPWSIKLLVFHPLSRLHPLPVQARASAECPWSTETVGFDMFQRFFDPPCSFFGSARRLLGTFSDCLVSFPCIGASARILPPFRCIRNESMRRTCEDR